MLTFQFVNSKLGVHVCPINLGTAFFVPQNYRKSLLALEFFANNQLSPLHRGSSSSPPGKDPFFLLLPGVGGSLVPCTSPGIPSFRSGHLCVATFLLRSYCSWSRELHYFISNSCCPTAVSGTLLHIIHLLLPPLDMAMLRSLKITPHCLKRAVFANYAQKNQAPNEPSTSALHLRRA